MPKFEVEVLSNPWTALGLNRPIWDWDDYSSYAQYDIDLIKPALLFADHVTLATFRETMLSMVNNQGSALWRMPMNQIHQFLWLARARPSREISILGLDPNTLPTAEAEALINSRDASNIDNYYQRLQDFWDRYEDQIDLFVKNQVEIWRQRRRQLTAGELNNATLSRILTVESWGKIPDESRRPPVSEQEVFEASVQAFLDRLERTASQPLLDVGSDWIVKNWPHGSDHGPSPQPVTWRGPTMIAANAVMRLPGLERLSLKEILDVRDELTEYLPSFRSEMIRLGQDLVESGDGTSDALVAEIDMRWHRDIAPVLEEIRKNVAAASYGRRLLNTITAQKDAMVSAGGAVVLATGSVAAGVSTLVPAVFAAAYPLAKALNDAIAARSSAKNNRLYLLYALEKNIEKRHP
jgi:hypothetical protein